MTSKGEQGGDSQGKKVIILMITGHLQMWQRRFAELRAISNSEGKNSIEIMFQKRLQQQARMAATSLSSSTAGLNHSQQRHLQSFPFLTLG